MASSNDVIDDDLAEAMDADFLGNELEFPPMGGPFYHDCSPAAQSRVHDNFSEAGPLSEPADEEATHIRIVVHLWALIDWSGNVGPQTETELRRMAKFISDKADAVAKKCAEQEAYLASILRDRHEQRARAEQSAGL
jgi:hypothetical protein